MPEVWIVDLVGRVIEICRQPDAQGYAERETVQQGVLTPRLVPTLTIDVPTLIGL